MKQEALRPSAGDALVVVDVQNDFLQGGSLAVPGGEQVVPVLDQYLSLFRHLGLPVFLTRDWHPSDHSSFRGRGGPWPPHCVQGTRGAAFAPGLRLRGTEVVVSKGSDRGKEGYSGFETGLLEKELRAAAVKRLFVGGLATDYCVLSTVLDSRKLGFEVVLLADVIRAVDVEPGDGERALREMTGRGARTATYREVAG